MEKTYETIIKRSNCLLIFWVNKLTYNVPLRLWNFRKYCAMADGKPGLEIHFQEGVNVLIGENDSGKQILKI